MQVGVGALRGMVAAGVGSAFGGIKKWFKLSKTRYKGLAKNHTLHVMRAIAYNVKRAPGLMC